MVDTLVAVSSVHAIIKLTDNSSDFTQKISMVTTKYDCLPPECIVKDAAFMGRYFLFSKTLELFIIMFEWRCKLTTKAVVHAIQNSGPNKPYEASTCLL